MGQETTEKIVEAYVRYVKGWATIANIKCPGQLEIDLLAIDPVSGQRYHIESGVSVSGGFSKLTAESFSTDMLKQSSKQAGQRRTIGYFRDRKFSAPGIIAKLEGYGFKSGDYRRIIVTWGWTDEAKNQADAADIELWDFRDVMLEIAKISSARSYFTDDTLRTLQLMVKSVKERGRGENHEPLASSGEDNLDRAKVEEETQ